MRSNVGRAKRCPPVAAFVFRVGVLSSRVNLLQRQGTALLTDRIDRLPDAVRQRRFREHTIPDDADVAAHRDDMHFNTAPAEWPYSTSRAYIARALYSDAWVGAAVRRLQAGEPD